MDGGAWWAAVHGVAKSQVWLSDFTFTLHFHALEKEMATHSSVLALRITGTREPGGLLSMGSRRVGHDWSDLAAAAAAVHRIAINMHTKPQKVWHEVNDRHVSYCHENLPSPPCSHGNSEPAYCYIRLSWTWNTELSARRSKQWKWLAENFRSIHLYHYFFQHFTFLCPCTYSFNISKRGFLKAMCNGYYKNKNFAGQLVIL